MSNISSQGQIGAGQQDPFDSVSDFAVTSFIVRQMMALIETMLPVQVVAVNLGSGSPPAAGTVDVQILVSLIDGSGNVTPSGIVHGVPFFRLQGGSWSIICDPAINDFGFLIAAARDTSKVNANPGIKAPGSFRKYSYSDGIYVGGALNAVSTATVWLKPDGTWILTDKPGNVIQGNSNGISMTPAAGSVQVNGALTVSGNLQLGGNIASVAGGIYSGNLITSGNVIGGYGTGDQVGLKTHTHTSGSAGTPTSSPTAGT